LSDSQIKKKIESVELDGSVPVYKL